MSDVGGSEKPVILLPWPNGNKLCNPGIGYVHVHVPTTYLYFHIITLRMHMQAV